MTVNRLELVGLSVLVLTLTTTVSLEQNVNPVLSGNTVVQGHEAAVSPSLPTSLQNQTTGTNPFSLARRGDLWEGGGP
jgi:hypothetical protein